MGFSARTQRATFPADRLLYYYVTDRKQLRGGNLLSCIGRAVVWGVDIVQIREKDLPDFELYRLTRETVAITRATGCKVIVNGRADVALSAGAQGVHLPSAGLKPSDIRPWVPDRFIIGVSVHSCSEALQAESDGADYVLLGSIYPTPSKSGYGRPLGVAVLLETCKRIRLPVFGLGGIDADRIKAVWAAGASGVAAIRMFQENLAGLKRLNRAALRSTTPRAKGRSVSGG